MRAYDIIYKKRMGQELTREEIAFLIDGFVTGDVPDYQMSALRKQLFCLGRKSTQ